METLSPSSGTMETCIPHLRLDSDGALRGVDCGDNAGSRTQHFFRSVARRHLESPAAVLAGLGTQHRRASLETRRRDEIEMPRPQSEHRRDRQVADQSEGASPDRILWSPKTCRTRLGGGPGEGGHAVDHPRVYRPVRFLCPRGLIWRYPFIVSRRRGNQWTAVVQGSTRLLG